MLQLAGKKISESNRSNITKTRFVYQELILNKDDSQSRNGAMSQADPNDQRQLFKTQVPKAKASATVKHKSPTSSVSRKKAIRSGAELPNPSQLIRPTTTLTKRIFADCVNVPGTFNG